VSEDRDQGPGDRRGRRRAMCDVAGRVPMVGGGMASSGVVVAGVVAGGAC
jgi:hypothetical protein